VAGNPAKPSAARRSWPRWSDIVRSAVDRSTARTRHPHAVTLDAAVKLAAVLMLLEEGAEGREQQSRSLDRETLLAHHPQNAVDAEPGVPEADGAYFRFTVLITSVRKPDSSGIANDVPACGSI